MNILPKRILIALVTLSVVFTVTAYFFIPDVLTVSNNAVINCNIAAASRMINYNWMKIFNVHSDSVFYMNNYSYKIEQPVYNGSYISVRKKDYSYKVFLFLIPISSDTSILQMNASIPTSKNPFIKIFTYFKARALKNSMYNVINQLQAFLQVTKNIYHYNITRTTLNDTILMFTKKNSKTYPSTNDIYTLIKTLKLYIAKQNAIETNRPMLNIVNSDSGYTTMVGIPINREIAASNTIMPKYLRPMKNKILTVEVHGGLSSIKDANKQIEQFMLDHSLSSPVMPFELMITDRSKQADTTKWVTKIFYPII